MLNDKRLPKKSGRYLVFVSHFGAAWRVQSWRILYYSLKFKHFKSAHYLYALDELVTWKALPEIPKKAINAYKRARQKRA